MIIKIHLTPKPNSKVHLVNIPVLIDVMHWSCHPVTSVVQMGLIMIVCNDVMICMDHVLR